MPDYPELFVLRHGQTEWNLAGRFQGRLNSPLTALGMRQAADQGRVLQGLGLDHGEISCFSSPQGRAVETAKVAFAALGRTPTIDQNLQEIAFGKWEGLTGRDIDEHWPGSRGKGPDKSWYFNAPGGESQNEISGRVTNFLQGLTGPTVVVTHGFTSLILRGIWLGLTANEMLSLPHQQGCVYHLASGRENSLIADDFPS